MGEKRGGNRAFLYFATCTVNLLSFATGDLYGWTSPALPRLDGSVDPLNNPLGEPLTSEEASWIASLLSLGCAVGSVIFGVVCNKIGPKKSLMICSVPLAVCYITKSFAGNVSLFYFARVLGGLGAGAVFTIVPMYVGEIAEDEIRGKLNCLMPFGLVSGILFSYCVGSFISIKWFSLLSAIPPTLFFIIALTILPDSPYFFIKENNPDGAKQALKKIRRTKSIYVAEELILMEKSVGRQAKMSELFSSKAAKKSLCITVALMVFQQLSGVTAIIGFSQTIFQATKISLPSELGSILFGLVQFFVTGLTSLTVDKLGRRPLILISFCGSALAESAIGLYFFLQDKNYPTDSISWLPITGIVIFTIFYNFGMGPIPYALTGELFAPSFKAAASAITMFMLLISAFLTTVIFPYMIVYLGFGLCFWTFAACCAFGFVFSYFMVQETKGKSFEEIQEMLER